jgi:two-component system chemotaxis response regulator CheY
MNAKVLVVDDSALSRRMSRRVLEEAGHTVVEAEDGIIALERYFLEKPDLVLLDITMRGLNGIEVLRQIRMMDDRARVVILTADVQSSTRTMTDELGAAGFITKPLSGEELTNAVNSLLQGGS